jgi:hypothetical protein
MKTTGMMEKYYCCTNFVWDIEEGWIGKGLSNQSIVKIWQVTVRPKLMCDTFE